VMLARGGKNREALLGCPVGESPAARGWLWYRWFLPGRLSTGRSSGLGTVWQDPLAVSLGLLLLGSSGVPAP